MIYGIRRNCMNQWKKFFAGADLNTNFWFHITSYDQFRNRLLAGTIFTDDYKPSECITQQQQFLSGCLNKWVQMFPKGGGDFWFWPTEIGRDNPKLITGWVFASANVNMAGVECTVNLPKLGFEPGWTTTLSTGDRVTLTQNGLNITGTITGGGRFEGPVVFESGFWSSGSWNLDTTWYRGTASGRAYVEWRENGGLGKIQFFGINV
ncbi:hypothetical protein [Bacillus sp. V2I10]|uniref:hypothetical protein n=1 Tax=Bacillus sp. V2I10 TaxID=3042276 RepID=UPI0027806682|nr:hypothetical protein [Bacillus sp. V2I10]MDQ0862404.1 hypothetical protein [Bacillus sp. V2I10]